MDKEERDKTVAKLNSEINNLEDQLNAANREKVTKYAKALQEKTAELERTEAARLDALQQLADLKANNLKIGDVITMEKDGKEIKGTVKDRPLCVLFEGSNDTECLYSSIVPPQQSSHKQQNVNQALAIRSTETAVHRLSARLPQSPTPGDIITVSTSNNKAMDTSITRTNGVVVNINGVEECIFPKNNTNPAGA